MSNLSRVQFLRIGQHATAVDFLTAPGTLKYFEPLSPFVPDAPREHIERPYQSGDGERYASILGRKMTSGLPSITLPCRGLSDGGAGNNVAVSSLGLPEEEILESCFGEQVDTAIGDTSDGTDAGTATELIVDAAPGTPIPNGGAALIMCTTSGKRVAREIVSLATDTYTLSRLLTRDDGTSDTPDEDAVVYAAKTFIARPAAFPNRKGLWIDTQGGDWRYRYKHALARLTLEYPSGGLARFTLQDWMWHDFDDDQAQAVLAFDPPDGGSEIVTYDAPMLLNDDAVIAYGFSVDLGVQLALRGGDGGPSGTFGAVVLDVRPKFTFRLRAGELTTPKEITEAYLKTMRTATFDIHAQQGREPGSCHLHRMPAADLRVKRIDDGGMQAVEVEAFSSRRSGAITGGYRLHVF